MNENTDTHDQRQACPEQVTVTCPCCGDARVLYRGQLEHHWEPGSITWLYFLCDNEDCEEGDFDWPLDAREREAAGS